MRLDDGLLSEYRENGHITVNGAFNSREVAWLRRDLPTALADASPRRVMEQHGRSVRGLHGQHETVESFGHLARHPRLVVPARQLLGDDVFVYQFKVNTKAAFTGDLWPWHQDFIFWQREDGMEEPRVVNAVVLLDDNTEFNGPLLFMEGSHREGVIEDFGRRDAVAAEGDTEAPSWLEGFTANLKYTLSATRVSDLARSYPLRSAKAEAGSVLFFHPNLVHGSSTNMTPFERSLILITYGSVATRFRQVSAERPSFLVNRDVTPLQVTDDSILLERAQVGVSETW